MMNAKARGVVSAKVGWPKCRKPRRPADLSEAGNPDRQNQGSVSYTLVVVPCRDAYTLP